MSGFLAWLFTGTTEPLNPIRPGIDTCSFCEKLKPMRVEGPYRVSICLECAELAARMIREKAKERCESEQRPVTDSKTANT